MLRIHTDTPREKWRLRCPRCHSVNWRVHNGTIGCRNCGATLRELEDGKSGSVIDRDEIEFVGPGVEKIDFAEEE